MHIPIRQGLDGLVIHPAALTGSGLTIKKKHHHKKHSSEKQGQGAALLLSHKSGAGVNELSDKLSNLNLRKYKKSNIKFII